MSKPKFSLARNDPEMHELMQSADHQTLAFWAIECVERVMPFFEKNYSTDPRPRNAINTLKGWINTGNFKMSVIRKASLDAHKAARDVGADNPARSAAHAAGQAVATAHVRTHAYGPAIYAQQAIFRNSAPDVAIANVARERDWQYSCLEKLVKSQSEMIESYERRS